MNLRALTVLSASACLAALVPTNAAFAASERSPFIGQWELDLTRMPETYGSPPKRVVYRFVDEGSGIWRTTIDITAPDDSVRHISVQYRRDGQMVMGEGDSADGESAAVNSPAPNVLVMSLAKNKGLESVRVYAVSSDRSEMTESAADVDDSGRPFVRNFHFKRIE